MSATGCGPSARKSLIGCFRVSQYQVESSLLMEVLSLYCECLNKVLP